jgi:hypothetical protein
MVEKQDKIVAEGRANLAAGLISKLELTKELQTQNELQLALLDNQRTRLQTNLQMKQMNLAQRSLAGEGPAMPEIMAREEQVVRIELEILRVESEQRAKVAERKVLVEKLATVGELEAQVKGRPTYRATEKRIDVAFVPYTQSTGVNPGASVYECVWGVFNCKKVGEVTEIVGGEVVLPDPWGNQARGQFAVLKLSDDESAKAKTLRIRSTGQAPAAPSSADRDRVSLK